ncbi:GD20065 [Drosophila simulans]|uniref:GD20065 n=1 Tax=Drosophila simulans TaxID=7240 RepID=B4QS33_DROSI|nr:GD20065 [Drosophila simulans]
MARNGVRDTPPPAGHGPNTHLPCQRDWTGHSTCNVFSNWSRAGAPGSGLDSGKPTGKGRPAATPIHAIKRTCDQNSAADCIPYPRNVSPSPPLAMSSPGNLAAGEL